MKKYEYKFVEVPRHNGMKVTVGETFEECKEIILQEAEQGWRLVQIVMPFNEKTGAYTSTCYQVIFEKEV